MSNTTPTCVIINSRYADFSIERSVLEPLGVKVIAVTKSPHSQQNLHENQWGQTSNQSNQISSSVTLLPEEIDEHALVKSAHDADALLINLAKVTKTVIDALPRLKVISRYGVGLDNIDVAYAQSKGISVLNVPDYCTDEVAEHTLALMLALLRGIPNRSTAVKTGLWDLPEPQYVLRGQTIGIIGYGNTARAVIARCLAFKPAEILVYSRHVGHVETAYTSNDTLQNQVTELKQKPVTDTICNLAQYFHVPLRFVSLETVLKQSTIISLHTGLSPETYHMLDKQAFSLMKHGVFIINTARGGLIDFDALHGAIEKGIVEGAGLDVFESEPPTSILTKLGSDKLIVSDHTAFRSIHSIEELKRRCAQNAARGLGLL